MSTDKPGTTIIGGYKLMKQLNQSQKTQVYEVVEPNSNRHLAMKLLLPEYASDAHERQLIINDAEIGMKMRHENVVHILKLDRSKENPFFIMELFPAGDLRKRLRSKDPKDAEFLKVNARKIFKQMATGLAYMNGSGFVHCDIKPDNVLVNSLGQAKIIDFAISKPIKTGFFARMFGRPKSAQGTHNYMAPEMIRNELLDGRADIYCFAATWFELVTGRPPFRAQTLQDTLKKQLIEAPTSPTGYNNDVTEEFSNYIIKMLSKKREDRPESFHQVLIDMRKIRMFKSIADEPEEM